MNIKNLYLLFPAIVLIFSVYIRLNFWPFVNLLGTYQGDWWYFYHYYGQYIAHSFFFPIEYPVGYILIQKFAYFISMLLGGFSYQNFILGNAFIFIPAGLLIFVCLDRLATIVNSKSKRFIIYLTASPTFLIASTTNYDLLPTLLTLLAILLLIKNQSKLAFLILALGTTVKIYPGFLLPLFILYQLGKKSIILPLIIFITTIVLINLPFALYNFQFWLFPYTWQSQNPQMYDFNTLSYYLIYFGFDHYRTLLLFSLLLIAWFISWFFYKKSSLTNKNFLLLCYLTIFTAVLGNHVNTPQYMLWFLPFVSLLQIPAISIWWPFDLINSTVLFSYFRLTHELRFILDIIFRFIVIYFIFLYLRLIYELKKCYEKD
ncbi:DUF2029 domain-containing protein [Candidatus Daviesbacteria bacterium]|nr:DUF2029 domain-containing protein [Candidatus Daviesbacteria bacterium]